jgi:hypothetical protein
MLRITQNKFGYDVRLNGCWIASITKAKDGWQPWGAFPDMSGFETVGAAANAAIESTIAYS